MITATLILLGRRMLIELDDAARTSAIFVIDDTLQRKAQAWIDSNHCRVAENSKATFLWVRDAKNLN